MKADARSAARDREERAEAARPAAELFVRCLESEGTEYVFGIPGEETVDLNDALEDSSVEFVPVRHEQAAAFMADAYGRLTGRPGVCLATLGPGATNLVTGIGDATLDKAPLVAITGQVALAGLHRETHQFIDTVEMLRPMTKFTARVHDPRTIPEVVRKAFQVAVSEKPGATHIELPEDVMRSSVVGRPLPHPPLPVVDPDEDALQRAAELLVEAERPVVLAGNGVVRAGAAEALREFCRATGLRVITTFMGKGVVDAGSEHYLFTAGLRSQDYPAGLLGCADLVMTVGYEMIEWAPAHWNPSSRPLITVDSVPSEIDAHLVPDVELVGDIRHTLDQLGHLLRGKEMTVFDVPPYRKALLAALDIGADDDHPIKPQRVLRDLRIALGSEDVVVSDVGAHKLWLARFWEARQPNTMLVSNGFASMGFALPGAIAATLALPPERKVVAVCGDGGFLMNVQELETAKRLGRPFVVLVWSDGSYGLIEIHQQRRFGRTSGTRFGNPDIPALARAFGLEGERVGRAGDLLPALRRALAAPGPVVLEVPVDYRENEKLAIDLWELAPGALGERRNRRVDPCDFRMSDPEEFVSRPHEGRSDQDS
jgi:acetolactate synthase I/II/III large subunit